MAAGEMRTEPAGLLDEIEAWIDREAREFRAYMASPEGRQLRRRVAQALIIGAPFLFRMGFVRRHPVGRILGLVGGAALLVKLAEALRDWEPLEELAEDLGLKEEDDFE
jgi:4-amino-4-deoxy-L-arabinose transferase-like glycosyltransferase